MAFQSSQLLSLLLSALQIGQSVVANPENLMLQASFSLPPWQISLADPHHGSTFSIAMALAEVEAEAQFIQMLESTLVSAKATRGQNGDEHSLLSFVAHSTQFLSNPQTVASLLREVLEQSRQLNDLQDLSNLLEIVAGSAAKIGQPELTISLFQQVLDNFKRIESPYEQYLIVHSIVQATHHISDRKTATLLLQKVDDLVGILHNDHQIEIWIDISQAYSHHVQAQRAQTALETAIQMTRSFLGTSETSTVQRHLSEDQLLRALKGIVQATRQLSDPSAARQILSELQLTVNEIRNWDGIANEIIDWNYRIEALSLIAQAYGELSDLKMARAILEEALKTKPPEVTGMPPAVAMSWKIDALTYIALAYASFADNEMAWKVWQRGLSLVNSTISEDSNTFFVRDGDRSHSFKKMVGVAAMVTDPQISEAMFRDLLAAVQTIDSGRSFLFRKIAQTAAQESDTERAQWLLQAILELAISEDASDFQEYAVSVVAQAAAQSSNPDAAAPLLLKAMEWAKQSGAKTENKETIAFLESLLAECCLEHEVSTAMLLEAIASSSNSEYDDIETYETLENILTITEAKLEVDHEAIPAILESLIPAISQFSFAGYSLVPNALQIFSKSSYLETTTPALHAGFLLAESGMEDGDRMLFLNHLARAYAQLSEMDKAQSFLQQRLELQEISSRKPFDQAASLIDLALTYQSLGNSQKASESLQKGLEITQMIQEDVSRHRLLLFLSETADQLSEPELARNLLLQAVEVSGQIDESEQQLSALYGTIFTVVQRPPSSINADILDQLLTRLSELPAPHNERSLLVGELSKAMMCQGAPWSEDVVQLCKWWRHS